MATGDAGGDHGNSCAVVDLEVTGALSGFHSRKGLSAMATAKMLVDNGVVKALNLEEPGKFEVSSAEKMLEQVEKGTYFLP